MCRNANQCRGDLWRKCCSNGYCASCTVRPDATTTAPATTIVSSTTTSSTSSPFTSSTTGITPQSSEPYVAFVESSRATTTAPTTRIVSPTTTSDSQPGTVTSSATTPTTNNTTAITTESTSSPFTSSTTGITPQSRSSTAATAAGVSVAVVALAVAAVVIVFVLRKKEKLCFAITRGSKLENPVNNNHISLARIESKPNAHYQSPLALGESEAHLYSVLEKDGFEHQRNDITSVPVDVHDYFVLEKQKPAIDNGTGVSINEIHTYFVLETQGGQPAQEMTLNETNPYFVLEKENTGNSGPKYTAHALELDTDDRDMYQEIDSNDTYTDIDDLRQGNNNYDYTIKAFTDSKTDLSHNVYNHLNSAGDEYDHVGIGQNNVKTI